MLKKIIEDTTSAVVVMERVLDRPDFFMSTSGAAPVAATMWAWGLAGDEKIELQFPTVTIPDLNNDAHWTTISVLDASTKKSHAIGATVIVRLKKPITVNSVGVMLATSGAV